ncbi:MAG: OadG family protein [Clostridiales bacterium]|nr:OadG family protein [Clostridiales bacterium]
MDILLNKTVNQAVLLVGNADKNLGEEIKYAALNTLVGMSVVFGVLILLIIVISLFKFIPALQSKFSKKAEDTSEGEAIDAEQAQFVSQEAEEEELVDDYELVAVITAAIYASMGTEVPADGLVVRSIRRIGKRNRLNA